MQLPEGAHLSYTIDYEAWYSQGRERRIYVHASHKGNGGGVSWEFSIVEVNLGHHATAIQARVFDDAFAAFNEMPEFFTALAADHIRSLDEVRVLLDRLGAVDETDRVSPIRVS